MKNNPKSRREFLLKFLSKPSDPFSDAASTTSGIEQNGKIKMLTPDGKLVEVDLELVKNSPQKNKVSNAEILKWMEDGKKKP